MIADKAQGEVIAIDGKTLRRSYDKPDNKAAIHMVNAWATLLPGFKKRKRLESLTSGVYGRIAVVETAFLPTQRQA